MLTVIVARARNNAIGKGNTIPWHAPEDLQAFKRETLGGALIMGRRTWDSLPVKPLPGRLNLVVSRNRDAAPEVAGSTAEALERAAAEGYHRVYAIGGASIYADLLPLADRLLITDVDLVVEDADAFFPALDLDDWRRVGGRVLSPAPRCTINEYLRRPRA